MSADPALYGMRAVLCGTPDVGVEDQRTNVTDTLTNIMHYCDRSGIEFENTLSVARTRFLEERYGPGTPPFRCAVCGTANRGCDPGACRSM